VPHGAGRHAGVASLDDCRIDARVAIRQSPRDNREKTMRFGKMAVAAAVLACAGQADAARYYEFELKGSANTPLIFVAPGVQRDFNYADTIRFVFDTLAPPSQLPYYFAGGSGYSILMEGVPGAETGSLSTLTQPGGPLFAFGFSYADVPLSDTLSSIGISNTGFGYRIRLDGRYGYTYDTLPGRIVSFRGRTTDVAPALVGAVEALAVTLLPEPASWAMMILGVALVGAGLRRRRPVTAIA
jgi:hypothetical protein